MLLVGTFEIIADAVPSATPRPSTWPMPRLPRAADSARRRPARVACSARFLTIRDEEALHADIEQ